MKIQLEIPVPGQNHTLTDKIFVTQNDKTIYVISELSRQETNEPIKPGHVGFQIEVEIKPQEEVRMMHVVIYTEKPETQKIQQNKATLTHYIRNTNSEFLDKNCLVFEDDELAKRLANYHQSSPLTYNITKHPTFTYDSTHNTETKEPDSIDAQIQKTVNQAQPKPQTTNPAAETSMFGTVVAGTLAFGFFAAATIIRVLNPEPDHHEKLDL